MTTDELFKLYSELKGNETLRHLVENGLAQLVRSPEYQQWHSGLEQARPFVLPESANLDALRRVGLVSGNNLNVRVNHHADRLFLTDGVWVDQRHRVFPFCDESASLLAISYQLGWAQAANCVIDLAGGCGHNAWAFNQPMQVLYDINPRALAYAELNKLLNNLNPRQYVIALNDIRYRVPVLHTAGLSGEVLVLANMPFAPSPGKGSMPLTSEGGQAGMDFQIATFDALRSLLASRPRGTRVRALIMGVTLGCAQQNRWVLVETAAQYLSGVRLSWQLCAEPLLRIDGRRVLANPSSGVVALPALSSCQLYFPNPSRREYLKRGYEALADKHQQAGNPD